MKTPYTRLIILCAAAFFLQGSIALERLGIPDSQPHPQILQQSGQRSDIDHQAWDKFLTTYTQRDAQGVVRLDYANVTTNDHAALQSYIQSLGKIDHTQYTRDAQLAFWVNLYNAITVNVILDHYPVPSIHKITNGFFDFGPWNDDRFKLGNIALSLHDIENGIVRPMWPDTPETHYLLNCAAAGCPNLGQYAYTAQNIQESLRLAAIDYINHPRGVFIAEKGEILVSKIYGWYIEDFGNSKKAILEHLRIYAKPKLSAKLQNKKTINKYFYDWSLNDQKLRNSLVKPKPARTPQ